MEYGNDSDPGARHYIGLSRPYSTVRDRRASNKGQSSSVCSGPSSNQEFWTNSNKLYNSNPNIELLHALRDPSSSGRSDLRRASGSLVHSSTPSSPVKTNESFFAMLQDYQPAVLGVIGTDQRSPGPAEFMQGKVAHATPVLNKASERSSTSSSSTNQTDSNSLNMKRARDPKVKNKLHRFLAQSRSKTDENIPGLLSLSLLTKNCAISEDLSTQYYPTTAHRTFMSLANMEEQQRQRVFAHYDCQSIAANYSHIRKLRAASIVKSPSNASSSSAESVTTPRIPDLDYINYNELVENCPQFCNETGAENRLGFGGTNRNRPRRPVNSYSISILESLPNETLWRTGACPFQNDSCPIEALDHGAYYYRGYFYNQKHENWFGIDEHLGPVAVSLKKDKLPDTGNEQQRSQQARFQFRIIIRTSELLTLRGLVIEDAILSTGKSLPSKELIEFVAPEIQTNCLRLGVSTAKCEQQLLKLDEQALTSKYKVGILYCRSGQCTEEDMYNNEDAGPAFLEFLDTIGKRVRLKGFQHYKAGLDNKTDSTGTHSVHNIYKDCEIMFHVCTMLPFTPNNRQQLLRKRHIGNDIVTIVFQEPGALPFSPKNIRSQFQHVFVIVRAINPCTDHTTYRVAISRSKEVPVFGPPLPVGALFSRNKAFAEYILAKIINAENAAHRSEKFATLAKRTRREYLKDLSINYCTNVYMDPGNKFSIFPSKKKDKPKIRFSGDAAQRGAISWQIMFQDHDSSVAVECFLGISVDTLVIMDEESQHVIFVTPTRAILGWSTSDNSLRIFYHNGECVTINMRYFGAIDEQLEVVERLQAVTLGNGVLEMSIRRNMMGQLGFHVQPDGIVTQVEATGQAWAAGMRRGFRLVEVCKIVVASLSYREMIDLLKTSIQLTFVVIKSFADGSPRRGCFDKHCKMNYLSIENDHEVDRFQRGFLEGDERTVVHNGTMQQIPQSALRYEQIPYKSTNRSGYNTTSSTSSSNEASEDYKKAFHTPDSCSPHSHNNDKWYDILEDAEKSQNAQNVTLSIHHQYTLKSFAHPKLKESASLPLNSQPLPLSLSDGAKPQTSRQLQMPSGDFSNVKQPVVDSRRLLRNRGSKYDIKCVNFYPSESTTAGISIRNHNQSFDAPNVFEEKHINSTPVHKGSMPNMQQIDLRGPVLPCSTTVKTAKLLPSMGNYSPMNSIQRNMQNYSKTDSFRRDLLELIGPNANNNSSACDSLKARRNSAIERATTSQALDNVSAFMPSDFKQPSTQLTFDVNSNDAIQGLSVSSRPGPTSGPHSMLRVSRSSPRLKSSLDTPRPNLRSEISLTPPLLPDANELDWTTLVDTATQAIVQQFRDENSLKALPLCSGIDNIRNDTDGKLQETLDT